MAIGVVGLASSVAVIAVLTFGVLIEGNGIKWKQTDTNGNK
jgi:hypothetical protein